MFLPPSVAQLQVSTSLLMNSASWPSTRTALVSKQVAGLQDRDTVLTVLQLTCGNIGKGTRIAGYTSSPEYLGRKGEQLKKFTITGQFQIGPGFVDTLLPALTGRHTMCITSTGCMFPKTIRKLYETAIKGLDGDFKAFNEARELQDKCTYTQTHADVLEFR